MPKIRERKLKDMLDLWRRLTKDSTTLEQYRTTGNATLTKSTKLARRAFRNYILGACVKLFEKATNLGATEQELVKIAEYAVSLLDTGDNCQYDVRKLAIDLGIIDICNKYGECRMADFIKRDCEVEHTCLYNCLIG